MNADSIQIDLNRLSFAQYLAFLEAGEAADDFEILSKVVVAWPLPADPSDPASYPALGMLDLLAVQAAFREAVQGATSGN